MNVLRLPSFVDRLTARFCESPPDDIPPSLSSESKCGRTGSSSAALLAGLVLLCAIPRIVMMWRIDAVCTDGYYYISIADLLGRGEFDEAFGYLNVNLYTAVLLAVHKLGFDWVFAGQLIGLVSSCLVVLPLFGWVRRACDEKVAAVACFLYAIHPELIEISAEPLREPLFWLCLNSCLYLCWRSVTEPRWWWFAGTGFLFALASYTRLEGWLLLLPILLWPALCRAGSWAMRLRLAAGTVLCLSMLPVLLVLVNVGLLRHHDRWEWGRFQLLQMSWQWLTTEADAPPAGTRIIQRYEVPPRASERPVEAANRRLYAAAPAGSTAGLPAAVILPYIRRVPLLAANADGGGEPAGQSSAANEQHVRHLRIYLKSLAYSLELPNCLLLLTGLLGWRRLLPRREFVPLVLMALLVFVGVWLRLSMSDTLNGRYFFTGSLVLLPFSALGFLTWTHRLATLRRPRFLAAHPKLAVGALAVALALVGCGDAVTSSHNSRQRHASLGRRLRAEFGPVETVLADNEAARVGYYALETIPEVCHDQYRFARLLQAQRPMLVILSRDFFKIGRVPHVLESEHFQQVRLPSSPAGPQTNAEFVIFLRDGTIPRTAQKPREEIGARR